VQTESGENPEIDVAREHWFIPVCCKGDGLPYKVTEHTPLQFTGLVVRRSPTEAGAFERVALLTHAMPFSSWEGFARGWPEGEVNLV
jgi:hypothetical protein